MSNQDILRQRLEEFHQKKAVNDAEQAVIEKENQARKQFLTEHYCLKIQTSLKDHYCDRCGESIPAGERHRTRGAVITEPRNQTTRWEHMRYHLRCSQ